MNFKILLVQLTQLGDARRRGDPKCAEALISSMQVVGHQETLCRPGERRNTALIVTFNKTGEWRPWAKVLLFHGKESTEKCVIMNF